MNKLTKKELSSRCTNDECYSVGTDPVLASGWYGIKKSDIEKRFDSVLSPILSLAIRENGAPISLLDVGSGAGLLPQWLARSFLHANEMFRYMGVEPNEHRVKIARNNHPCSLKCLLDKTPYHVGFAGVEEHPKVKANIIYVGCTLVDFKKHTRTTDTDLNLVNRFLLSLERYMGRDSVIVMDFWVDTWWKGDGESDSPAVVDFDRMKESIEEETFFKVINENRPFTMPTKLGDVQMGYMILSRK